MYDLGVKMTAVHGDGVWQLVRSHQYRIEVQLLSTERQRVYRASNVNFGADMSGDVVTVLENESVDGDGSGRHTLLSVEAVSPGDGHVTITLLPVVSALTGNSYSPPSPVLSQVKFAVTEPINVVNLDDRNPLSLPWIGSSNEHASFTLEVWMRTIVHESNLLPHRNLTLFCFQAAGGSGEFIWTSENPDVATVDTASGVVFAAGVGKASIVVVDKRNALNRDVVEVLVSVPRSLSHLSSNVEFEVGDTLPLHFAFLDSQGRHFTNCDVLGMAYSIDVGDSYISITDRSQCFAQCPLNKSMSCFRATISASDAGHGVLKATLTLPEPAQDHTTVVRLAAFQPITLLPSEAILATGGFIRSFLQRFVHTQVVV